MFGAREYGAHLASYAFNAKMEPPQRASDWPEKYRRRLGRALT